MNKFSTIVILNESDSLEKPKNTYLLNKKVTDFDESYTDLLDLVSSFKESYSFFKEINISKGYVTSNQIKNTYSVNVTNVMSVKGNKGRKLFPSGDIPDKWIFTVKVMIFFKEFDGDSAKVLPQWVKDEIYSDDTIVEIIDRFKAVKTLSDRAKHYGANVKISYNNAFSVSLLFFFK